MTILASKGVDPHSEKGLHGLLDAQKLLGPSSLHLEAQELIGFRPSNGLTTLSKFQYVKSSNQVHDAAEIRGHGPHYARKGA